MQLQDSSLKEIVLKIARNDKQLAKEHVVKKGRLYRNLHKKSYELCRKHCAIKLLMTLMIKRVIQVLVEQ